MEYQSEQIGEIAKALSLAQKQMSVAVKGAKNPFFRSSYADYNSIAEAVMPCLNANGIAVVQTPVESEHGMDLVTTLAHESGQWFKAKLKINPVPDKNGLITPQALGSAISYARRYCLSSITACSTADDDGEQAMNRNSNNRKSQQPQQKPPQQQTKPQSNLNLLKKEVATKWSEAGLTFQSPEWGFFSELNDLKSLGVDELKMLLDGWNFIFATFQKQWAEKTKQV